jgi:uncharacterized membrane protein
MNLLLILGTLAIVLYAIWSVIELIRSLIARWKAKRGEQAEQNSRMTAITPRFKPLHGQRRISYYDEKKRRL